MVLPSWVRRIAEAQQNGVDWLWVVRHHLKWDHRQITAFGIDAHELHHSLLVRDFTELTALYRILSRQKTSERLKDVMQRVAQQGASRPKIGQPAMPSPRAFPMPGRPAPFPGAGQGGARQLTTPVAAGTAGRRGSRPVAVRPNVALPGAARPAGPTPHEAWQSQRQLLNKAVRKAFLDMFRRRKYDKWEWNFEVKIENSFWKWTGMEYIHEFILNWFYDFLSNCTQTNHSSCWLHWTTFQSSNRMSSN
jgi:hypothetical protein